MAPINAVFIRFLLLTATISSPLFTQTLYKGLGVQWGSSVPAFLSLVCAPIPFLFAWKFGKWLRNRSKLTAEARKVMAQILQQQAKAGSKDVEKVGAQVMAESLISEDSKSR
jgi:hypothetical protein